MIGQQLYQRDIVPSFCCSHSLCGKTIKTAMVPYNKVFDSLFDNETLHRAIQKGAQCFRSIPVTDKKAYSIRHVHQLTLFLS